MILPFPKSGLTPEEENLVALFATIIVDATLKQAYEESYNLPAIQ